MYDHQKAVRHFHQKFGLTINNYPTIPSREDLKLRARLLLEESLEFAHAAGFFVHAIVFKDGKIEIDIRETTLEPDLVGMADALADIQYVNDGAAVTLGINLEPLAAEVHHSNMSKLWEGGVVKKDSGGKVIKSPDYSPADIKGCLRLQLPANRQFDLFEMTSSQIP